MPFEKPVVQLMTESPITLTSEQKLSDARDLMSGDVIHHLPVVDDGKLVGILSASDLVKLSLLYDSDDESLSEFLDRHYTVGGVMQKHPITIGVEATVGEAAVLLSTGAFHALPVIGYDGSLKGIVTTTDMVGLLIESL